jgi:putative flippase GtrA
MTLRFLRFLISGGSAAAVEYAAFFVLQATLGPSWLLASQSLSFACGFVVSFLLNRHWVFHSEGKAGQELLKYGIVAGINLAAGNLAMLLMVGTAGMHPLIAKFLVMGMIAAWNYLIFSRLVFSNSAAQQR